MAGLHKPKSRKDPNVLDYLRHVTKKSEAEISQTVKEIGRMFAAGMVDREIIDKLQLKRATYYWYRKRLFRDSGNLFKQTSDDELIYHKDLLQERLTRMYRQIELDLRNTAISNKDRAGLYLAAQSYAMNIFRLNYEGIAALKNAYGIQGRQPSLTVNTSVGSQTNPRSGARVIRLLQAEEPGPGARQEDSSVPSPIVIEEQEPDESEIY